MESKISTARVFLAMPNSPRFEDYFKDLIYPALSGQDIRIRRLKRLAASDNVLDRMIEEISQADLVIALISGRNSNVFLEAGIALGSQTPCIFISKNQSELSPFRHFGNTLFVDKAGEEAVSELRRMVLARL